jgi:hypothetical protein
MQKAYTVDICGWNPYFPGIHNYAVKLADGTRIADLIGIPGGGFYVDVMATKSEGDDRKMDRYSKNHTTTMDTNVWPPVLLTLIGVEEYAEFAFTVYNERVAYCNGERNGCR